MSVPKGNRSLNIKIYDALEEANNIYDKEFETGIDQINGPINTPAQLTANVDDYAPVDDVDPTITFAISNIIRQDLDQSLRSISGFVAPPAGIERMIKIGNLNNTTFDLRFLHDNAGSLVANRLLLRDAANKDLHPNETAGFWYDHVSSRWRVLTRVG